MTRNTAGEGSVHKTSDGRWRAAVALPNGERRYLPGRTKSEVSTKRREVLRALDAGQPVSPRRPGTFDAFLQEWLTKSLPARVAASRLSPETLESYRIQVRLHVTPHLGSCEWTSSHPRSCASGSRRCSASHEVSSAKPSRARTPGTSYCCRRGR